MKRRGFTFIELLIVMAVVGIISAICIPSLLRARHRADFEDAFGIDPATIDSEAERTYMAKWIQKRLNKLNAEIDTAKENTDALYNDLSIKNLDLKKKMQAIMAAEPTEENLIGNMEALGTTAAKIQDLQKSAEVNALQNDKAVKAAELAYQEALTAARHFGFIVEERNQ